MEKLRLKPRELDTNQGFGEDIFEYRAFGENLRNLVCGPDRTDVFVLDGGWGTGKTTFIKQWLAEHQDDFNAIYFDAFAHDFKDDPFVALSGAVAGKLKDNKSNTKTFVENAANVGKALLPVGAKAVLHMATAGTINGADAEEAIKSIRDSTKAQLTRELRDRIDRAASEERLITDFKKELHKASKTLNKGKDKPLVFVIDELDRCKPSFALEVLELIKHVFSAENVCFLLVTNLNHLARTVEGRYGNGVNGFEYLQKFYGVVLQLLKKRVGEDNQCIQEIYTRYLMKGTNLEDRGNTPKYQQELIHYIFKYCENRNTSLRTIENMVTFIKLWKASGFPGLHNSEKSLHAALLVIAKVSYPEIFEKARLGAFSYSDAHEMLGDHLCSEFNKYGLPEPDNEQEWCFFPSFMRLIAEESSFFKYVSRDALVA